MDQETIRKQLNKIINKTESEISIAFGERLAELLNILKVLYDKVVNDEQITWTEINQFRRVEQEIERIAGNELEEIAEEVTKLYSPVAASILASQYYIYTEGYLQHLYLFQFGGGVENMEISLPSKTVIDSVLAQPINKIKLKPTLERQRRKTLSRLRIEIAKSVEAGEGYDKMARRFTDRMEMSKRQALLVARAEGKRAMEQAGLESARTAEEAGARLQKVWNATLDFKTRDSHQALDGQTVAVDEPFTSRGCVGLAPTLFKGLKAASENINCRCSVIYKVNGILPSVRRAKEEGKDSVLVNYMTYKEWRASLEN